MIEQTADGMWALAVDHDHAARLAEAADAYRTFLARFPLDSRAREATARRRALEPKLREAKEQERRQEAAAAAERREQELVDEIKAVTVEEIVTDRRTYSKRSFIRRVCCSNVALSNYGYDSPIAELHWKADRIYNTECGWKWRYETVVNNGDWVGHIETDSKVEVRLSPEVAQRFPREAAKGYGLDCKYQLDAVLFFGGQINDLSHPVMYLKSANFNITPEPVNE